MLVRTLASLIVLLFLSSNVVGKDYVGSNNNAGYLSPLGDKVAPAKDVFIAFEDSKKETEQATPVYSPAVESLEPRGSNVEAKSGATMLGSIALPTAEGKLDYFAAYDKGFGIFPYDKKKNPFELKINGWIQFRHHAFAREVDSWTDNAGITRPVKNRNAFDIERARLSFKGTALDPRLTYFYQLDGDTDGRHAVDFFDYWWAWKVSDRFRLQFENEKYLRVVNGFWVQDELDLLIVQCQMTFSVLTEQLVFGGKVRPVRMDITNSCLETAIELRICRTVLQMTNLLLR